MTNKTNTTIYNETEQLEKLLKAISKVNEDADNYLDGYFKIEIAGETIQLAYGGPQLEGLYCLVDQIAAENLYEVDYENNVVTE